MLCCHCVLVISIFYDASFKTDYLCHRRRHGGTGACLVFELAFKGSGVVFTYPDERQRFQRCVSQNRRSRRSPAASLAPSFAWKTQIKSTVNIDPADECTTNSSRLFVASETLTELVKLYSGLLRETDVLKQNPGPGSVGLWFSTDVCSTLSFPLAAPVGTRSFEGENNIFWLSHFLKVKYL